MENTNVFVNAVKEDSRLTYTENGAQAYSSTLNSVLDLFGSIGSLRMRDAGEITRLFDAAYEEDKLLATKCLFYSRDIREGLGERNTFRILLKHCAIYHPEAISDNIHLIGIFGRYDDMYTLVGTPLEADMWLEMKIQFTADLQYMKNGEPASLLAKWIKTPDASSAKTRKLGILTAINLGYSVYEFKRLLRSLRKYIDVVERKMSADKWNEIEYSSVPSRASMIYKNAFMRHDEDRYTSFINKVFTGEEKINAGTLYPYDLVRQYIGSNSYYFEATEPNMTVEAQWKALPNYIEGENNILVMADVSGSMFCNNNMPISSAIGLGIYFAERNKGPFKDLLMTFSSDPSFISLKGADLYSKALHVSKAQWGGSTDLERAFIKILKLAKENHIPQSEMPKSLIVISDMEINYAMYNDANMSWSFYDNMRSMYEEAGYEIPNVVFWNVNSRHDVFHSDADRKGVQLVSGSSASTFKALLNAIDKTPVEFMLMVLNGERYKYVTIDD